MALQKSVGLEYATGVAGDPVNVTDVVMTAVNPTAETNITVGNFVFQGTDKLKQVKQDGEGVVGLAMRVQAYPNYEITSEGSLVVPKGAGVAVAVKGYFYVKTATVATVGQAVFANKKTGAVHTGGAEGTVDGCVKTSWKVMTAGEKDSTIVIGNWE